MNLTETFMNRIQAMIRWIGNHAVVAFILWAFWLSYEYFCFGPASYVSMPDNGDSNLPARIAMNPSISNGLFTLWNSLAASGTDRLSMAFVSDIDVLLFSFLPGWLAYGLIMSLQRFIAGYFTYRLMRDTLNVDILPAFVSAIIYSFFAQGALNHQWAGFTLYDRLALPGLPFLLWIFSRLNPNQKIIHYFYGVFLGALLALTSHYSYALFIFPVLPFWFIFITPRSRISFWGMLGLFAFGWALTEIPDLWSGAINGPLSYRCQSRVETVLNEHCSDLILESIALVIAFIRDNILSMFLLVGGFYLAPHKDRRLVALAGAILFCFGFIIFYQMWGSIFIQKLGWISGFNFSRMYLNIPFLCAVAGGLGLSLINEEYRLSFLKGNLPTQDYSIKACLSILCLTIVFAQTLSIKENIYREMAAGANFSSLYQREELKMLSDNRQFMEPFRVATVSDVRDYENSLDPSCAWAYGLETADGRVLLHTQRYHDFWKQVLLPMSRSKPEIYELIDKEALRIALFFSRKNFACKDNLRFSEYYDLKMLSLANVRYIVSPIALVDINLKLLNQGTEEKRLVWQNRPLRYKFIDLITGKYTGFPLYIYENNKVLPRFFLVNKAKYFDKNEQLLSELGNASSDEMHKTAYLKRSDVEDISLELKGGKPDSVVVIDYSSDKIVLNVKCNSPSILVIGNNYSPYWDGLLNNINVKIFPVNHTFQGIYMKSGQHEVILKYQPPYTVEYLMDKLVV